MDTEYTRKFLNKFLLTEDNDYYKQHKKVLSKVSAKQIRELRNSLIHFFP